MAQREAVDAELVLEGRPEYAALDPRRPRRAIDLEDAVERAQVDRHDAAARFARRLYTADDARSSAVGNRD